MKFHHISLFALALAMGCAVEDPNAGGGTDAGPASGAVCGNGILEEGEESDDGGQRNRDGCDRNCVLEDTARCGDGVVEGDEECDDRNTFPGDGCDERCRNENLADGNDTIDDAQAIDGRSVEGVIATPGDLDWYKFEVEAGQWLAITTNANPEDTPGKVDTVITLFDPSQTQVAQNDDAYPRRNTDSQLITKAVATGTYYIKLEEWTTWAGETAEGEPGFIYTLNVNVLSTEDIGGGAVYGEEGGNDAESAIELDTESKALILADLADGDDVDVYTFSVTDEEQAHFSAQLMPLGADGYGSTANGTRMWVADTQGNIISRISQAGKTDEVGPGGLALGDYHLHVAHSGNAVGSNDFYVIKFNLYGDNPVETEDETNGVAGTAEALEASADGNATRYFILAQLSEDDVDYFSFDLAQGNNITVACGSASSGSGVQGLRAEIRDEDDQVIEGANETDEGLYIRNVQGQAAGTYYLRLTATGFDAEVTGRYVRCGVHTGPPRG